MENTNPEHTKFTKTMLFILAVVLLAASVIGYFLSQKMNKGTGSPTATHTQPLTTQATPTPTLIPYPVNGSMKFRLPQEAVKVGEPFTIDVIATSGKDTVAGYDVVLSYDTKRLKQEAVSFVSDTFQLFTYKRANHVAISATKNLKAQGEIRFTNSNIVSVAFTAKEKGKYVFSLRPVGNESSKFVSETAAVTYPETQDISLEIK